MQCRMLYPVIVAVTVTDSALCVCVYQGVLCRTLQGHAMWVNFLALSADYVLRTGAFDPTTAALQPSDAVCSGEIRLAD